VGRARLAAVLAVALAAVLVPPPAPAAPLKVVTFNMFHGGASSGLTGDDVHLERRLAMAAEALGRLAPDVIALQEASAGRGRGNVAARLAAQLGYVHVYAPATTRALGVEWLGRVLAFAMNFQEGSAILSRFPIVQSEVHGLPRCRKFFDPRIALRARLATPDGPVDVFSTHTSRDDCQVRRVFELAAGRRDGVPALVMGDFNTAEPMIEGLRPGEGVVDAYRRANPTAAGATVWQRVTAPEPTATRRVDYVFVVPGRPEGRVEVAESRVVLDTPARLPDGGTLWPSDHYGVLAHVDLGGAGTRRAGGSR
jgi:endonuclease/exonuclease/phosphatase family metal-dependent hydrolase